MNLGQLETYCALRFRDVNNTIVATSDWANYLNDAYHDMLSSCPWFPWNEAVTYLVFAGGQRFADLPTDVWNITAVWDMTNQFPLIPLEGRNRVYTEYPQETEVGQAMHYRVFNNQLQVYPMPLAPTTYLVEYVQKPVDLGSGQTVVANVAGAPAGNVTVTGIVTADTLSSVIFVATGQQSILNLTAEFTITGTNIINNTGGHDTSGGRLTVTYTTVGGSTDVPIVPLQYHTAIAAGAIALAYIDDGNLQQAVPYTQQFAAGVQRLIRDVMQPRADRYPEPIDSQL